MPENLWLYTAVYLIVLSMLAILLTVYDKHASRRGAKRIRERTLLIVSVLGGSFAMLLTMHMIRHKTKHKKFMAGIPAILLLQIGVVFWAWQQWNG